MSLVGRLEDLALSDIFQILSIGRKTGTLILKGSSGNALIVFKKGLVVRAETNSIKETLADDLLNAHVIKDTVFHLALKVKKQLPEKPVHEILIEFGSIDKETLEKITRKRVEKIVYELLLWQNGDFQFDLDDIDPRDKIDVPDFGWELTKGMSPEYLLVESARVHDESSQQQLISTEELTGIQKEEIWEEDWDVYPPVERKDIASLKALTQELRFPTSASEITLLILRFASEIFQRGILFMVGEKEIVGLGQFGLDIERPDEKIREIILSYESSNFLNRIITEKLPYKGTLEKEHITEKMVGEIGGGWPQETALFPIVAEGRVVALLYCDNKTSGERIAETEGLEIFIDQAGLALEKSLLQRRLQEMEKRTNL